MVSCFESYKVVPKRNYLGAYGFKGEVLMAWYPRVSVCGLAPQTPNCKARPSSLPSDARAIFLRDCFRGMPCSLPRQAQNSIPKEAKLSPDRPDMLDLHKTPKLYAAQNCTFYHRPPDQKTPKASFLKTLNLLSPKGPMHCYGWNTSLNHSHNS